VVRPSRGTVLRTGLGRTTSDRGRAMAKHHTDLDRKLRVATISQCSAGGFFVHDPRSSDVVAAFSTKAEAIDWLRNNIADPAGVSQQK
jgi:hypothetical protein